MDDSGPGGSDGAQAFPFPFAPYPIQQQLMQAIFDAIEERKIGIFESPTGTVSSGAEALRRAHPS